MKIRARAALRLGLAGVVNVALRYVHTRERFTFITPGEPR